MSISFIEEKLKILCLYNTVEIDYVFRKGGQDYLKVCCSKGRNSIQLIFLGSGRTDLYDDLKEASVAINELINKS